MSIWHVRWQWISSHANSRGGERIGVSQLPSQTADRWSPYPLPALYFYCTTPLRYSSPCSCPTSHLRKPRRSRFARASKNPPGHGGPSGQVTSSLRNEGFRVHPERGTRCSLSNAGATAFSKKWENLRAALALYFAHYNFCRAHSSLSGCTPAMAAGVTDTRWTMADLLA